MDRAQLERRASLKKRAAAKRTPRLVSGAVTLTWAADQLKLSPTGAKRVLHVAGIRPLLWVDARGGRRLPVFSRRAVFDLAQARAYQPPQIGGLRAVAAMAST